MATTAIKTTKKAPERTWTDDLHDALADLDRAREGATGEVRAGLDRAVARLRSIAADARSLAGEQVDGFEASLDRAGEEVRVELGRRAVRAQQTPEALTALGGEIRRRRAQLTA
ncbi:hypothetical protein FSW04_20990 [Baekduia soli]|uniref:Uncharacterized protein n=1 Tax=Baekduia soli TaxID=496014 RepID=A0A5B8U9Q0_9ACTN|nr:hypothetical protein [Baekduia soli]QEC49800.1 hypothetical protein FSW04_20990 [Baekduia soli]